MVQENFGEMTNKATETWNGTVNKALEAFAMTSDFNRDISGRGVDLNAAIAREGVQYASDVQAALRQASDEARQLWTRQTEVVQDAPKDVMAATQKAVALSGRGASRSRVSGSCTGRRSAGSPTRSSISWSRPAKRPGTPLRSFLRRS